MPLAMGCPTTSSSFPLVAYTKDPENCCLVKFHWEGSAFLNSSVISCVVGGCCEAVLAARPGADRDGRPPPSDPRKLPLEEEEGLLLLLLLFLLLLLLPPPPPNCFIRSAMDLRGGGACLGPDSSDDEEEDESSLSWSRCGRPRLLGARLLGLLPLLSVFFWLGNKAVALAGLVFPGDAGAFSGASVPNDKRTLAGLGRVDKFLGLDFSNCSSRGPLICLLCANCLSCAKMGLRSPWTRL
mmetsp:Transcript_5325/g.11271  ORF Transcript_5325/g.11271 Transcript_5325/m.11271 type:complete len:240 (-) Transcript_5325:844-1563(-)